MLRRRSVFIITAILFTVALLASCADGSHEKDYRDPEELRSLVTEGGEEYHLVDVRTDSEYSSGHIPTAENIPYDQIAGNLPTEDRDALIIVYCRSGNRSGIAANILKELGFIK